MGDLNERFRDLSPEKRKLLEQLLRTKASERPAEASPSVENPFPGAGGSAGAAAPVANGGLQLEYRTTDHEVKESYRKFYNEVSKQLDSTLFGNFSYFLNYGYLPDGSPEFAAAVLPEKYINKNSVRLVLEVIGDCDLKDRRVLDVGCGRGGTIFTIHQFFQPASMTGIDLSANAIQFCRRAHKYPRVTFREGDAENLPFGDSSFDVVTNVESSHSYPNIRSFYLEVYRVLVPGGHFLYTDVMPRDKSNQCVGIMQQIGFTVERDRDITANVLSSCNEVAPNRVQAFHSQNDQKLMQNFLSTPGSQVYEEMRSRAWLYRIFKLRKS